MEINSKPSLEYTLLTADICRCNSQANVASCIALFAGMAQSLLQAHWPHLRHQSGHRVAPKPSSLLPAGQLTFKSCTQINNRLVRHLLYLGCKRSCVIFSFQWATPFSVNSPLASFPHQPYQSPMNSLLSVKVLNEQLILQTVVVMNVIKWWLLSGDKF